MKIEDFAGQLERGLRKYVLTIREVCEIWGIHLSTYQKWVRTSPEFAKAHEKGQEDSLEIAKKMIIIRNY